MTLGVGNNLALDLTKMAKLLMAVNDGIESADLSNYLGFHQTRVDSTKSWARHMGLLEDKGSVSCLGKQMLTLDPTFEYPASRLLLYYYFGHNAKAEVFYFMVNNVLYNSVVFNREFDVANLPHAAAQAGVGAKSQSTEQFHKEISSMRLTLSRSQAFGPLGILSSDRRQNFTVYPPTLSPAFVAYIVNTEWREGTAYTNFDEFEQPGRLARVCLLTRSALINALRMATRFGYLSIQEEAGFDRVGRVSQWSTSKLLEAIYA